MRGSGEVTRRGERENVRVKWLRTTDALKESAGVKVVVQLRTGFG